MTMPTDTPQDRAKKIADLSHDHGSIAWCAAYDAVLATLASPPSSAAADLIQLIETRLLGIDPDNQDLVLEDDDWRRIISALRCPPTDAEKGNSQWSTSQKTNGVGTQPEHPLLLRAYEVVHHESDCPSIGGRGDADCRCDAVPFLRDLETALSSTDAVALREALEQAKLAIEDTAYGSHVAALNDAHEIITEALSQPPTIAETEGPTMNCLMGDCTDRSPMGQTYCPKHSALSPVRSGEGLREALEDAQTNFDNIAGYTFEVGSTGLIRDTARDASKQIGLKLAALSAETGER